MFHNHAHTKHGGARRRLGEWPDLLASRRYDCPAIPVVKAHVVQNPVAVAVNVDVAVAAAPSRRPRARAWGQATAIRLSTAFHSTPHHTGRGCLALHTGGGIWVLAKHGAARGGRGVHDLGARRFPEQAARPQFVDTDMVEDAVAVAVREVVRRPRPCAEIPTLAPACGQCPSVHGMSSTRSLPMRAHGGHPRTEHGCARGWVGLRPDLVALAR
jgi:hypothetical protein